MQNIDAEQS